MPSQQAVADNPFPDPELDGWRRPENVRRFSPDNLYEKIDGRADVYLQFNVVGLTFGTYLHESGGDRAIDVYWYDMGRDTNALGVYQAELPPDVKPVPIGSQGYAAGGAVFFRQGGSYVQVLPLGADPQDATAARAIAGRISDRLEASAEGMWAKTLLPESGQVPGSFSYQARNAFGLDFLHDVFAARYEVDGQEVTLFIHRAESSSSALAVLAEYERFFAKFGRVIWKSPETDPQMIAGEVAGVIDVVFAKGRYLGGVSGADDADRARKVAAAFCAGLAEPRTPVDNGADPERVGPAGNSNAR